MSEHCKRVSASTNWIAEQLHDIGIIFTFDNLGYEDFFREVIVESQRLIEKLEIVGFYYEHKIHLP